MRVLFSCVPGHGHLHPLVPLARALDAAGCEVAFATEERFCRRARLAGFAAFPAGLGSGRVLQRTLQRPDAALPDEARPDDAWRFGAQLFAAVAAPAKVPDLVAVIADWEPALVVHETTDFAAPVAAALAGIPWVAHGLGPLFPMEFFQLAHELVKPVWEAHGLPALPLGGMFHSLYLDICPPSLQSPAITEIAVVARSLRPVPFDAVTGEDLPGWVDRLGPEPTIYVTLGTVDNDAPGVIEAVVEALRDEPVNLVVTVGPGRSPGELGAQPPNVHVEQYVPQSLLFPHCDAVVTHGGSGTVLAALGHGLPLLVLPQGANQFWNAARCAALGAGIRLLPDEVRPPTVAEAVHALLDDPSYRSRAGLVAGEIAAMPGPDEAVALLEDLALSGQARA